MSQLHCTTRRRKGQHIRFQERQMLEYLYDRNRRQPKKTKKTQKELASLLGWSEATLSRELRRGRVTQVNSQLEEYTCYSATVAQAVKNSASSMKGPSLKIGKDHELANKIEQMLIGKKLAGLRRLKYSPEAIVMYLDRHGWPTDTRLCARTIYNYVEQGVFLHVTKENLPRKGRRPKRPYRRISKRIRSPEYKRIYERPEACEQRSEPGHWEMDCIESVRGDRTSLLTLVDRHTRDCLLLKIRRQSQEAVIRRLNGIERRLGAPRFRAMFKSITVDNGSEFLNWKEMEASAINKGKRTEIYYANPYSSWERGSNENLNGFIRYFIPKGTKLKDIGSTEIKELERFINSYPRKILGGLSALEFSQATA